MIYRCTRSRRRRQEEPARRCRRVGRGHGRCTWPTWSSRPGSAASVTTWNDIGQTVVPLLHRRPGARGRRPPLDGPAAHLVVPARRRRRQLGPRPGGVDLVRGGPATSRCRTPAWPTSATSAPSPSCSPACSRSRRRPCSTMGRARAVLDGLITTSAMVFASYGTFLGVVYTASEGRLLERVLAVTYPAADLVTVAVVLAVLARREPAPVRAAAARGGRRRVPRGRRQRVRLHDRQGHLRQRSRHRPRLAARVRAPRPRRVAPRAGGRGPRRAAPVGLRGSAWRCPTSRSSPGWPCSSAGRRPATRFGPFLARHRRASWPLLLVRPPGPDDAREPRAHPPPRAHGRRAPGAGGPARSSRPSTTRSPRWPTGRCSATASTTPSSSAATSRWRCCSSTSTTSRP